ncbi:methyltransferase domain-containing protein [Kitasatospora sp. NPDC050463]|uniref:SAM-dependent methyltransferase n=1 Tax=Kitasatospora sp. NPDC050463 TaxID=3155786 RepID=UPI0033F3DBF3
MTAENKSVEVLDDEVQQTWKSVAEAGAGELASSYVLTTAIVGLSNSGVADRLSAEWTPLAELAPKPELADRIGKVLRFLELRGIVESQGDTWRTTRRGAQLLDEVAESLLGYYVDAYGPVLHEIGALLDGSKAYGTDVTRDTEALGLRCETLFNSFGGNLVRDLVRERGARGVLDLGCGTGGLVLDLVRENPELRGFGLDIAQDAIDYAGRRAAEQGVADRLSFLVADAFRPQDWPAEVVEGADFYVAVGALHEHFRDGEAAVVDMLGRYADLLRAAPNRTLLLCEPELLVDSEDANFYLIHVLTEQGFPRPRDGWLKVIEAAGLTCKRVFSAPNTAFRFAYYEIVAEPSS